ncbi:hypothetical protein PIB30_010318 [Stylosanthes scabra]|uniref:Uncharacterized protein n=1 Tax=Stylosanthes scabra TaxID=79078 RepID=A0ABU6V3N4_9FABA|nr:hypothetical protein [Stylosanthes scabra]
MAYHHQNNKHHNRNHYYEYGSYPYNDNTEQPAARHHHYKGFSTIYEHPTEESYSYPTRRVLEPKKTSYDEDNYQRARYEDSNSSGSVDQEADAFIQYEHNRMELAKLMSMGAL